MKSKRLAAIVVTAAGAATVVGGMSFGFGPQHGARCAALHAKANYWQQQANAAKDPKVKLHDQNKANRFAFEAAQCDARATTTSSSAP